MGVRVVLPPARAWRAAQGLGVALTLALLVGLVLRPAPSLRLLWDMGIPLLPATFLVSPMLWRNVCPLATLGHVADRGRGARLRPDELQWAWAMGALLLFVMVPARRFLFNEHGVFLAGTIGAVGALAASGGLFFSRRAGFCNSICPVLPVEKLYGQLPVLAVPSAVCPDCTACAARGCIDLVGEASLVQSIGKPHPDDWRWMTAPSGTFALLFPGFVLGYFHTTNGGLETAPAVYAQVGIWALSGAAVFGLLIVALGVSRRLALPLLGAGALAGYYWYAGPSLATAYGVPALGPVVVRGGFLLLVGWWLLRALRLLPRRGVNAS